MIGFIPLCVCYLIEDSDAPVRPNDAALIECIAHEWAISSELAKEWIKQIDFNNNTTN